MQIRSSSAAALVSSVVLTLGAVTVVSAQTTPSPVSSASPMPAVTATPTIAPTATPVPKVTRAQTRARLGQIDALAQRVVRTGNVSDVQAIDERWSTLRSHMVAYGAARNDLIATDTAVKLLPSASNVKRGANAVTAALAPMYPAVGDHVPANVHRLDYLDRAVMLDVAAAEWTRANNDVISAESTWGAVRNAVVGKGAKTEAAAYTRALNAVQDGVAAQSRARTMHAVDQAESALGNVEKTLDQQVPPWRIFLQKFGM